MMTIYEMIGNREGVEDALETVIWYNGHAEWWLLELAENLYIIAESPDRKYCLNFDEIGFEGDHQRTEEHMIWEMLCSMFGEWGSSIRYGWLLLEKAEPCANFISDICADMFVYDYEHNYAGWSEKYPHIAKYYKETYGFEEEKNNE